MGRVDNFPTCSFFLKGFFLFQTIDRHFSFISWRKSNGINIFFSSRFRKKTMKKKKKTQKSNLLEMAIKAKKKIDAEPQSLKARLSCDGPDKISSKYVAKASRVRHTIISLLNHINYSNVPFYHRETIVRV